MNNCKRKLKIECHVKDEIFPNFCLIFTASFPKKILIILESYTKTEAIVTRNDSSEMRASQRSVGVIDVGGRGAERIWYKCYMYC